MGKNINIVFFFVLFVANSTLLYAAPTLQHQSETGLSANSTGKSVTIVPDGKGGLTTSKSTTETKTSEDGKSTTTTNTAKTHQTNKDNSSSDTTVKQTETKTTDKGQDGKDYVKSKETTTTKTVRTKDKDGNTDTATTKTGRTMNYNEDGTVKDGQVHPEEKLINKSDETETKIYPDKDGHQVTETKHPEEGTTKTTDLGNGKSQSVHENPDGSSSVTDKTGKESTTKYYDKDKNLTKTEKTDKKGNKTTENPDKNKKEDDDPFEDELEKNSKRGHSSSFGRDLFEGGDNEISDDRDAHQEQHPD